MTDPAPGAAVTARHGLVLPRLGQGTWRMGEDPAHREQEVSALRLGLDLGVTLIDTAEMYADGGAEEVVARAIAGRRDDVYLVTKVLPQNASREGTIRAAERSLARLATDRIDLYLLHWRGRHPLADTYEAFSRLVDQGKVVHWGVSNFDRGDMEESEAVPRGGRAVVNQVLYNPSRRGIEIGLLPWCRDHAVAVMAYTPLEEGKPRLRQAIAAVAARHGRTPAQVALAWAIRHPHVMVIPKASRPEHVRENAAALTLVLSAADLAEIDAVSPPPGRETPLETA